MYSSPRTASPLLASTSSRRFFAARFDFHPPVFPQLEPTSKQPLWHASYNLRAGFRRSRTAPSTEMENNNSSQQIIHLQNHPSPQLSTPANNNIVSDSDSNYYDELYPPDTTQWSDHQRIDIPGFRLRIPPVPAGAAARGTGRIGRRDLREESARNRATSPRLTPKR
ncbi:hypothetical protein KSP39_PZI001213 [Platanthera zijinensis]|uniref:Uncharacterized protein n=1 Tax=Platanthera zijinensis TaxID=2320716 RepID=A0AAP0C583_9ASPA